MKKGIILISLAVLLCGCNGPYNANGYNEDGYNWLGFNQEGYNKEGYNFWGYDAGGYNKQGYDSSGYNRQGYNAYGRTPTQQANANRLFWQNLAANLQASQDANNNYTTYQPNINEGMTFVGGSNQQQINVNADDGEVLGNLSINPYAPRSTANKYGAGSPYNPKSINNPYGKYGSRFSPNSANNPYAINTPKLYNSQGQYRGKLSSNRYDPDSISNPYGRYGNKYSPDSINNPYGAGSQYRSDSPYNPYGTGWTIKGK